MMVTDREIIIACLEGEELSEALKTISGNSLIEEVEFCLCAFDIQLFKEMMQGLATMKRVKTLRFMYCSFTGKEETLKYIKDLSISKIHISENNNFYKVLHLHDQECKYWKSLRELDLTFAYSSDLPEKKINLIFQELKHLTQLSSLNLDFSKCSEELNDLDPQKIPSDDPLIALRDRLLQSRNQRWIPMDFRKQTFPSQEDHSSAPNSSSQSRTEVSSDNYLLALRDRLLQSKTERRNEIESSRPTQEDDLRTPFFKPNASSQIQTEISSDDSLLALRDRLLQSRSKMGNHIESSRQTSSIKEDDLKTPLLKSNLPQSQTKVSSDNYLLALRDRLIQSRSKNWNQIESPRQTSLDNLQTPFLNSNSSSEIQTEVSPDNYLLAFRDRPLQSRNKRWDQVESPRPISLIKEDDLQTPSFKSDSSMVPLRDQLIQSIQDPVFCQGIAEFIQLTSLSLDLSNCQISEKTRVKSLSQGLRHLTNLRSLKLGFSNCEAIADDTIEDLSSQGLKNLIQLTSISLDFSSCRKNLPFYSEITDKGLNSLWSQALKNLTQLTSLHLEFSGRKQITSEGMNALSFQASMHLEQLTSLNIYSEFFPIEWSRNELIQKQEFPQNKSFHHISCTRIGDSHKIFQYEELFSTIPENNSNILLKKLELKLFIQYFFEGTKIRSCSIKMTDESSIQSEYSFSDQTQSKPLPFDVRGEELKKLCPKFFPNFAWIKSLNLSFPPSSIKDHILIFQRLKHLPQLTSLELDFTGSTWMTDEEINNLSIEGLRNLTQLTSLHLDFTKCRKVTDEGVKSLCLKGLRYLPKLTSLNLCFLECPQVTSSAMNNILNILYYFGFRQNE